MNTALVGCGGNGGVLAASLAEKGHSPVCIDVNPRIVDAIKRDGLKLHGKMGDHTVRMDAYTEYPESPGSFDVIILGVKSNVLGAVFEEATKHLCNNGFIVTIQNGLEVLAIAKKHTDTKMLCGAVGYNAVHEEFGSISVTSRGGITFCTLNGADEDDLFMMRGILSPMIPFHSHGDVNAVLWTKLLIVCGATGLGGVAGLRVGKLLRHRKARKLFYAMATEGSLLAEKLGIRLLKLPGAINPAKFGNHRGGVPLPLRRFLLLVAGITFAQLKSNIHVDLERGNKTEIDYINGAVVSEGERIGFDTPVNRHVVNMVKEIEDGHRTMCSENLSEMWNMVKDSPSNNIRDIE